METATSGAGTGAIVSTGQVLSYPDSIDSSPRSRGAESWDEPFPSAANSKLRLMCSYGGHIVPRPHDKSLCYLGGETRIVVVERHSTLADLTAKLSRSLLGAAPFNLKYQLPSEDLDSLISITTDEDLENMIEEYDRISSSSAAAAGGKSARLRLFLFPASSSAPSSIGSIVDDSKSDTWFVDALNSTMGSGRLSESASVNCLLGLEDDQPRQFVGEAPVPEQQPDQMLPRPDSSGKLARHGQDVHSVPDSPMLDTSSSFGSTSSSPSPSLSNLPPIHVRADDLPSDQRMGGGGFEEHFSQANVKQEEGFKDGAFGLSHPPPPQPINPVPVTTPAVATPAISPTENPSSRGLSSDDEKSDHGVVRNPHQPPSPQQNPNAVDLTISDTIPRHAYYQDRAPPPAAAAGNPATDQKQEVPVSDTNYRMQTQVQEHGYMLPMQPEQLHQQQQYYQSNAHLIPMSSYYQMHHQIHPQQQLPQTHQFSQQIPMYYLPIHPNAPYNLPTQTNFGSAAAAVPPIPSSGNPTVTPLPNPALPPRTGAPQKPELTANMYRTGAVPTGSQAQLPPQFIHLGDQSQQYMSYHPMHRHPSQSVTMAAPNQAYEFADPMHLQQVYYTTTQMPSSALPMQYQTMSSAASVVTSDAPPQLIHQSEVKQSRAS